MSCPPFIDYSEYGWSAKDTSVLYVQQVFDTMQSAGSVAGREHEPEKYWFSYVGHAFKSAHAHIQSIETDSL